MASAIVSHSRLPRAWRPRGKQPRARSPWASSPGARSPGVSLEARGEQGHYQFCVSNPSELAREFLSRDPRVCRCL